MIATADEVRDAPAPAKLNLFVHVTGRRADGYHLLETVFQLIDLQDRLHFRLRDDGQVRRVNEVPGVPADADLTVRAARLLQRESGTRLGIDIGLDKVIPMGGGLGGGSSDAATVLQVLNRLWRLDWPPERLMPLALALGADVPFFIFGRNAYARGIGEALEPIDLAPRSFVIIAPPVSVPTLEIFTAPELTRNTDPVTLLGLRGNQIWSCRNDLESVVTGRYPQVAVALTALRNTAGASGVDAAFVRMTGSGACVFCPVPTRALAESMAGEIRGNRRCDIGSVHVCDGLSTHPLGSRQVG